MIFDAHPCELGEGALWHPEREQLFWFDIPNRQLLTRENSETHIRQLKERVSAAGWVDRDRLMIASESRLFLLNLKTGAEETLTALESDNPATRSNDGRTDPWGGFWIGTMGNSSEPAAGAFWRYYRGELRQLRTGVTVPNSICFAPDGGHGYFTDTPSRIVMRQRLDEAQGWPRGEPEPWLDLRAEKLNPDGAVFDAEGNFWNAQWGARRVAAYDSEGRFLRAVEFPADHTSCPAFGGVELSTLYCTSAREGLDKTRRNIAGQGMTFAVSEVCRGLPEHRMIP